MRTHPKTKLTTASSWMIFKTEPTTSVSWNHLAADEVDAVRKIFKVQVTAPQAEAPPVALTLAVVLPLCLITAALLGAVLATVSCRRSELLSKAFDIKSEVIRQHEESRTPEEVVTLQRDCPTPPRLLICYSSRDGPAHFKAVNRFAAFVQQRMATQVCLDLWDSLGVAEEGYMSWYCGRSRKRLHPRHLFSGPQKEVGAAGGGTMKTKRL
ncbi:hypothetical protein OJAV_G00070580 [Oryzias javanicus]|uniref:SEFIR domain-containing protein n=1 Tax=Oryzias javanicus TaxID=123683 RepID=A0A437D7N8_ORYJA|nr:hypothetical protein OJAV_G00070580 [Oryzias javanicus]